MRLFIQKVEEKRAGKSVRRFCQEVGISHSLWSRIVRGEREPSTHVILAMLARWPELAYWLAEDAKTAQLAQQEGLLQ
ncbi:MAG: helix-turn-helix domain-containing protein [Sphingomonadaceae bacterium]